VSREPWRESKTGAVGDILVNLQPELAERLVNSCWHILVDPVQTSATDARSTRVNLGSRFRISVCPRDVTHRANPQTGFALYG
jgi:hypothetical protein